MLRNVKNAVSSRAYSAYQSLPAMPSVRSLFKSSATVTEEKKPQQTSHTPSFMSKMRLMPYVGLALLQAISSVKADTLMKMAFEATGFKLEDFISQAGSSTIYPHDLNSDTYMKIDFNSGKFPQFIKQLQEVCGLIVESSAPADMSFKFWNPMSCNDPSTGKKDPNAVIGSISFETGVTKEIINQMIGCVAQAGNNLCDIYYSDKSSDCGAGCVAGYVAGAVALVAILAIIAACGGCRNTNSNGSSNTLLSINVVSSDSSSHSSSHKAGAGVSFG